MKEIKKIAVLRTGGLGDFIVTLPALKAIKSSFPGAELILLAEPWHAAFLKPGRTPVDRVIVIPYYHDIRHGREEDPQELRAFFQAMRKEAFDIAFHFQGQGMAANPFLKKLGARITAGNASPGTALPDRFIPFYYYQNEITRYLETAGLLGATRVPEDAVPAPKVAVLEEDLLEARRELEKRGIHRPFVVLHPGATDPRRRWPAEKYALLGDALAREGHTIVLTGGAGDRAEVDEVKYRMEYSAINLWNKLSLGGLAGLLSKCELLISNDTGPLHLARAAGAKTTGIYWAPNFINWGPLSFITNRPVISWELACPRCGVVPNNPYPFEPKTPECDHEVSFVRNITVDEVLGAARSLLEGNSRQMVNKTETTTTKHDGIERNRPVPGLAIG